MEKLIAKILGDNFEMIRQVETDNSIYVFLNEKGYFPPYNDERLRLISGRGAFEN